MSTASDPSRRAEASGAASAEVRATGAAGGDPDLCLDVFFAFDRVGRVRFDPADDSFAFAYDPRWLAHPERFQLSPHLPLAGDIAPVAVRRYIDNLLPEGRALDVVASFSHVPKHHVFGLIRVLGADTAGALTFLPMGQVPDDAPARRRGIGFDELQRRIEARNQVPFTVWDGAVRMSVAGYQDKLLVLKDGDALFLADGALSSTHILKPEPLDGRLPHMVANEHFCMQLVNRLAQRRIGTDWAAEAEILRVPAPVLCVRRFDRTMTQGRPQRRHAIDGCQALNLPVAAKYERMLGSGRDVRHIRDGASFAALGTLRPHFANAGVGIRQLAWWAITTLLLGNSDAHGKNISFFVQGHTLSVSPFYDLVSVSAYDDTQIDHELAMAFGDAFSLADVRAFALADFCHRLGMPRSAFARELRQLAGWAGQEAERQAEAPVYEAAERDFLRGLAARIADRADRLKAMAGDIPRFPAELF